ncbi:hypothetical protein T02_10775, partial [Trichinella nativa]
LKNRRVFIRRISFINNGWRELKETSRISFVNNGWRELKETHSKQEIHSKHTLLKNKDNKHVNGKTNIKMSCNNTKSMQISGGSSECTCNVSQKCQQQICFRPTRSSRTRLIRRGLFGNNGRRELKETRSAIRKFRSKQSRLADHRAIENSVSTNHVWRERKETTRTNFGRNAKRHTTTLV